MKKTLRSRIAAVAVAAMGAGLLQAAPAFAALQPLNDTDVAVIDGSASPSTINASVGDLVSFDFGADVVGSGNKPAIQIELAAKPALSALSLNNRGTSPKTRAWANTGQDVCSAALKFEIGAGTQESLASLKCDDNPVATGSYTWGTMTFAPDQAGTYTFAVYTENDEASIDIVVSSADSNVISTNTTGAGTAVLYPQGSVGVDASDTAANNSYLGTLTTSLTGVLRNLKTSDVSTVTIADAANATYTGTGLAGKIKMSYGTAANAANPTGSYLTSSGLTGFSSTNANLGIDNTSKTYTLSPEFGTASASASVNLFLNATLAPGNYRVSVTTTSAGLNPNVAYFIVRVRTYISDAWSMSPASKTVAAGSAATFTATHSFRALADVARSGSFSSADFPISLALGATATGTSVISAAALQSATVTDTRTGAEGTFSASHTLTVTVPVGTPAGTYYVGTPDATGYVMVIVTAATYAYNNTVATFTNNGAGTYANGDDKVLYGPAVANSQAGNLNVKLYGTNGAAISNAALAKPIVVALTGVGSLAATGAVNPVSTSLVTKAAASYPGAAGFDVPVYSDGRAGTGTVTVTVDGAVVATKTVKFYGKATKVTVTPFYTVGMAKGGVNVPLDYTGATGGTDTATEDNFPAFAVAVTDANGTPVITTGGVSVVSSNYSVLIAPDDSFIDSGIGDYSAGTWVRHYNLKTATTAKSGDSATYTFSYLNSDGTVVSADAVKVTVGGAIASVAIALDKAAYGIGEAAVITVTAKDADGNAPYDVQNAFGGSLKSNLVNGMAVSSALILGGKATIKTFAPSVGGEWTVSGTDVLGNAIKTGTAKVSNADLDAVKAAADAAKAAADAAAAAAAVEAAKAAAAVEAAKAAAAADAAKAAAAVEAAKAAAAADAAKNKAAIDAVAATVTGLQTAMSTLVASVTATLTALSAKINKIMKKLNIK